jgi:steroid 5-alpha reductase family enzyme
MAADSLVASAGTGLLIATAIALPTWLASIPLRDASLADRAWSVFIAVPAAFYAWQLGADARMLLMTTLIGVWAVRLAVFVTARNWGHGEDRRYQAIRARNQPNFALKSLWLVFLLQAVLAWIVSLPVLAATGGGVWTTWDSLGLAIAAAGLACEAVADAQLAGFRRQPGSGDRVMDRGLWRYSRHPNYFGETCLWWGIALMALAGGGWARAWCLASPLLMTLLLLRVSGVTLLEKDIGERRPAYRDYIARTSAFVPWPPKRKPSP